jgi:hypothetical protein
MLGITRDGEALERRDMDEAITEPKSFTQYENGLEQEA